MSLTRVCGLILTVMPCYLTVNIGLPKPINTVSFERKRAKMECSRDWSNLPVDWKLVSPGSSNILDIYTLGQITYSLSSRYKIDTDSKIRHDIVMDSVDLSHAGRYICIPVTKDVINASSNSAELIVLASDPVCRSNASDSKDGNAEGDYIEMWCTVNYTGNWVPVMEWTTTGGQMIYTDVIYTNTSTTVTSSLITQLRSSDNGVTFTCKTAFNAISTKISAAKKPGEVMATNVPPYQHSWNFTANVHVSWISQIQTEQAILIPIFAIGAICCLVLTLYLCNKRWPYKGGIARPEPDILQEVHGNPYYIGESHEDHSANRLGLRSVQAVHPPGFQSGSLPQQDTVPVYAEVRRKEHNNDSRSVTEGAIGHLPKHKDLPVYTEVMKTRNESKYPDSPRQTAETTASQDRPPPSKTHTGADGTQYMAVTSMRDLNARAPIKHPPIFNLVETYASIDHTVDAPPPPLPPKRQ